MRRDKTQDEAIGLRIRSIRAAKGLTQETLAQKMGLSGHQFKKLSRIERGKQSVSKEELQQIAQALEIKVETITNTNQEPPPDLQRKFDNEVDILPFLKKAAGLNRPITTQELFDLLDKYCYLAQAGCI